MDPQGDIYEALKREFDRNYNGVCPSFLFS
jgi:hypothetical protein